MKKEKTMGELYPYTSNGIWGKILHFLKDGFWFLLIGLAILYFSDIKLFIFYAFFIILLLLFIFGEHNEFNYEMDRTQFTEIRVKLNLIAQKLNIEEKEIINYIQAEKGNGDNTENYTKELVAKLSNFGDDLDRIKEFQKKKNNENEINL
ncbi:MAG: hypothetical protein PHF44_02895 [Candidatus Pacebacteria bacterium]|nr:hypothetical protein [Candidatus Paceibacterota bacterium]